MLWLGAIRRWYWCVQGMSIGSGTRLRRLEVTWPHKVQLGKRCNLEEDVCFNFAGPYSPGVGIVLGDGCFIGRGCEFNVSSRISLGDCCLVGSGTRFIDHNHGMALGRPMKQQPETQGDIEIGSDVWIGVNSVILRGVTIGDGAVIAAGSIVTRSVPSFCVVAGVAARPIRSRTFAEYEGLRQLIKSAGAGASMSGPDGGPPVKASLDS